MPHKPWKMLWSGWTMCLALAIVMFSLAADSNAQESLQPYASPILHTFLDSANVYPESVTVDQSSGTFFVGSVKEGTIYKGKISRSIIAVSASNAQIKVTEGYFPGADGVKLFYRKLGSDPQTVVFLHGGPGLGIGDGGAEMAVLARDRVLLMYDQRGSGRSQVVTDPNLLSVDHQVRDLESFRQHFGLERMTLIGLSWGAGLATLYAAAHPDRVERLLLISPMPPAKTPYWEQRTKKLNELIGPVNVARLTAIRNQLPTSSDTKAASLCREYFRISSPPYLLNPKAFTTERSERMCEAPAAALRNRFVVAFAVFETLGDWDLRPQLAKITVPALVMEGEKTNVPLDATREWAAHLRNGKLVLIPKAGHVFFIEKPQAFFRAADKFLRR